MYYNMKLKTLKRWLGGQLKLAAKHRDDYAQQVFLIFRLPPLFVSCNLFFCTDIY
jgi:hypothetical protein